MSGSSTALLRALLVASLSASLTLVVAPPGMAQPDPGRRATPTLAVGTTPLAGAGRVSAGLVGGNLRWVGEADGAFAGGTVNAPLAALMRGIGLTSIRYSGGTVANLFDYTHATTTEAGCQTSGGFARANLAALPGAGNGYTLPQHAEFLRQSGAQTNLLIPMINASPAKARAYVKQVIDHVLPAGQKRLTVEIGNEPYLGNQRYWRSTDADTRLRQYTFGGSQHQQAFPGDKDYPDNLGLFATTGCDLRKPAKASGTPGETLRPRFTPFAVGASLKIVDSTHHTWRWVPRLSAKTQGKRVFTTNARHTLVRFGNGSNGKLLPKNATLAFKGGYTVVHQPGYVDFYKALRKLDYRGVKVDVCASWGKTTAFVSLMQKRKLPYDCLAVHSYSTIGNTGAPAARFQKLMTKASAREQDLADLRAIMRRAGHAGRYLIVTEYGTLNSGDVTKHFMDDLYRSRLVLGQIRKGVRIGNISNFAKLYDEWDVDGTTTYRRSAKGYVLSWVHEMAGQQVRTVKGTGSGIDAVAAAGGNAGTHLLVVNARSSAWSPRLSVPGRSGTTCVTIRSLSGSVNAVPRKDAPDEPAVLQTPRSHTWAAGASYAPKLAAHSVSFLTVKPGSC